MRPLFGAVAVVGFVALLAAFASVPSAVAFTDDGSLVTLQQGGLRYTYHVPTGGEALFDTRTDPRGLHNVLSAHPAEATQMRRSIEKRLHVDDLGALRSRCAESVAKLRSLGYL